MKKIVVGMDVNEEFKVVLEYAKKMSKVFDAELFIIHSETIEFYISSIVSETGVQPSLELIQIRKEQIKANFDNLQKQLDADGIKSQCILVDGISSESILKEAKKVNADMIVLGNHKHGRFYHLLFGSTHDQIINKSEVPVLIIPTNMK